MFGPRLSFILLLTIKFIIIEVMLLVIFAAPSFWSFVIFGLILCVLIWDVVRQIREYAKTYDDWND